MSNRLTDRDLNIPFVDKDGLVDAAAPFMLSEYAERTSNYEGNARQESVFTIYLIEGQERGYDQLLTFSVTAPRARLGNMLRKKSPLGPVVLVKVKKNKDGKKLANPRFEFVPVNDPKVIALADKLVIELRNGAITGANDGPDDDEPPVDDETEV